MLMNFKPDMKKIINPYAATGRKDYQCFGCSPNNENGLRLRFWLDGNEVVTKWNPEKWMEGYTNVLHGGIQATLLDEISSWVVQTQCKTVGVTTSMEVSYRKPVFISEGEITLRASLSRNTSRIAEIEAKLFGNQGQLCASAIVKYYILPLDKAKSDYYYPGADAFFENIDQQVEE
jgi:uncharacterized protein (TIGR00369 family)